MPKTSCESLSTDYSQYISSKECIDRGAHYFGSPLQAVSGLFDPDFETRILAVEILYRHWKLETGFLLGLMLELLEDPNEEVRGTVAWLLAELFEGSSHKVISRRLAIIAIDERRLNRERRAVWGALLKVQTSTKQRAERLLKLGFDAEKEYFKSVLDDSTFDRVPQMDLSLLHRLIELDEA